MINFKLWSENNIFRIHINFIAMFWISNENKTPHIIMANIDTYYNPFSGNKIYFLLDTNTSNRIFRLRNNLPANQPNLLNLKLLGIIVKVQLYLFFVACCICDFNKLNCVKNQTR